MDVAHTFRGRCISHDQIAFIREAISTNPSLSRRALSFRVCEAWNWRQPNGFVCDAICRSLLLDLHRAGLVQLPDPRWYARQPRRHVVVPELEIQPNPLEASFSQIGPIEIRLLRRATEEPIARALIANYHYLGYAHPVGERMMYLILAMDRPIACMCWSSAARHLGPRDRYIGWSKEARKANIRHIAYQSRFLILPWIKVPHLASHLLGAISRRLPQDWQERYHHPVVLAETFVDASRFKGTCYRAANWTVLGLTTGRGKADNTGKPNRPLKEILIYPLAKDFRQRLQTLVKET